MTPTVLKEKGESKELHFVMPGSDVIEETSQAIMPEIRGLEILKEGTYAVDLEKRSLICLLS